MKKLLLLAALTLTASGLTGLAGGTAYAATCTTGVTSSTDDSLAGVCVAPLGYIDAGVGDGSGDNGGVYVVAQSTDPGVGYVGVSNYETSTTPEPCRDATPDGDEGGSGTNSGGCYGTNSEQVTAPTGNTVPLPICGDDTGDWNASTRDGCRADAEDLVP